MGRVTELERKVDSILARLQQNNIESLKRELRRFSAAYQLHQRDHRRDRLDDHDDFVSREVAGLNNETHLREG